MRVNELINHADIDSWNAGEVITIQAGTGAGKSYFIKNDLYEYAKKNNKKILMLIHRKNAVDQFREELKIDGKSESIIKVNTYQSIESVALNYKKYPLKKYDYIICDEFHYFMSDANFNKYTDISLNEILKQKHAVKILMSATGNYMTQYLKEVKEIKPRKYELPIQYDYIKQLNFFFSESVLDQLIQQFIKQKKKAIIFLRSAKLAYDLHKKYKKYTLFNCSSQNSKYYKYVNEHKINKMLVSEKFNELILITTTALDTGVNIIDSKLNEVVIGGIQDIGVIIQCLGRKRIINSKDYINLTIQAFSNKTLGGLKAQMQNRIQKANFVRNHGTEAYVKEYPRNTNDIIVYDNPITGEDKVVKEVNEMIYYKNRVDIVEINKIIGLGEFGFCKYIAKKFQFYDEEYDFYDYKIIEKENDNVYLENYLKSVAGRRLLKDDQEQLKEVFKNSGLNARTLGINTLNGNLKDRKMPFIIVSKSSSRIIDGKKKNYRYWEVIDEVEI